MADINGAGGASLGGLGTTGNGHAEWWHAVIDSPVTGGTVPTTTPQIFTILDSWDSNNAQVQVQVSTSAAFGSTVHDPTSTQADGTSTGRNVTGLSDGTTYYVRARAGDGTHWGPWSATSSFLVQIAYGRGFLYSTLNAGVEVTPVDNWPAYSYENVGVAVTLVDNWPIYSYENVGVQITTVDNWPAYSYENVDSSLLPEPRIWFLRPESGRPSDGIAIYGLGFGDLQSTFSGVVEIDYGDPVGWVTVPVSTWQTYPADAAAYGPDRLLDETLPQVDMQHTIIEILIPNDAVPPGYPLRVRTTHA